MFLECHLLCFSPPSFSSSMAICYVYRNVWHAREVKPRFRATFLRSAHDCETGLLSKDTSNTFFLLHKILMK